MFRRRVIRARAKIQNEMVRELILKSILKRRDMRQDTNMHDKTTEQLAQKD